MALGPEEESEKTDALDWMVYMYKGRDYRMAKEMNIRSGVKHV